jgi:hypothetical protein
VGEAFRAYKNVGWLLALVGKAGSAMVGSRTGTSISNVVQTATKLVRSNLVPCAFFYAGS